MLLKIASVISCLVLAACAHHASSPDDDRLQVQKFKSVKLKEPVSLRMKVAPNEIEKTKFNSASKTEAFEGGSLTSTIEESIEFLSKSEVVKIISGDEFIEKVTTSKKDGQISLHDFAMPEPGEELILTYNSAGKVLKANNFSSDSLYFVPPISLPEEKVKIGDTWNMEAHWVTEQGVPLNLRLLSILKDFFVCGEKDICADIELSGDVNIDSNMSGARFESLWKGRVFFAIGRGSILWSLVESHEAWTSDKIYRDVRSCLESTLNEPAGWNPWKDDQHKCQIRPLENP